VASGTSLVRSLNDTQTRRESLAWQSRYFGKPLLELSFRQFVAPLLPSEGTRFFGNNCLDSFIRNTLAAGIVQEISKRLPGRWLVEETYDVAVTFRHLTPSVFIDRIGPPLRGDLMQSSFSSDVSPVGALKSTERATRFWLDRSPVDDGGSSIRQEMQRPSRHVANASRSRFARSRVHERTTTRWHRWPQSRR
jgi:hypothetical protein